MDLLKKERAFSDSRRLVDQGIHWQQQMEKMWNFIIFCHFHLLNPVAEGTATTGTLFKTDSLIYGHCVLQKGEKCTIHNLSKANFSSIRQDFGYLLLLLDFSVSSLHRMRYSKNSSVR